MPSLPYMNLNLSDYLADTAHLTTEQHGAYLLLMFNYWQRRKPLKESNDRLANIARVPIERWPGVRSTIVEFFDVNDNLWIHRRIERDLEIIRTNIANRLKRPPLSEWRAIRERIFMRDDYTCQYCGERGVKLECDHVLPVSRGGLHDDTNLVAACFRCNRSKRAKTPEEWMNSDG